MKQNRFGQRSSGALLVVSLLSCVVFLGSGRAPQGDESLRWEPARVILNQRKKINIRLAFLNEDLYISAADAARIYGFRKHWYRVSQRLVFEALDRQIEFQVGLATVSLNGVPFAMPQPPLMVRRDVYIPLNFFAEKKFSNFSAFDTNWNPRTSYLVVDMRPSVSSPSFYSYAGKTRIVLDLAPWIDYRIEEEGEDSMTISFPGGTALSEEAIEVEDGLIRKVHLVPRKRHVLLKLFLSENAKSPEVKMTSSPRQLIVEAFRKVGQQVVKREPIQKETGEDDSSWIPTHGSKGTPLRLIVLDAGHGGHDSGAVGPNGTLEKDINLLVAKELKKLLKREKRFKVLLTRRKDKFIPLAERTDFANRKKADLFISLHANASLSSESRGFEIYFLSEKASDPHAEEVARRENSVVEMEGEPTEKRRMIEQLLWSLARNEFMNESSELCGLISRNVTKRLKIQNRGTKQAGFYVLRGAQMPAVLVETAFISNPEEEILLGRKRFRKKMVDAVYSGIIQYERRKVLVTAGKVEN